MDTYLLTIHYSEPSSETLATDSHILSQLLVKIPMEANSLYLSTVGRITCEFRLPVFAHSSFQALQLASSIIDMFPGCRVETLRSISARSPVKDWTPGDEAVTRV